MTWSAPMDVTFGSAALAALCNSEEHLTQRWGRDIGRIVGRRLLDLVAATAATLDRLPEAKVTVTGTGETTITFADVIVVRGIINAPNAGTRGTLADADHMMITGLDVQRDGGR
jgi:hypothetical protein